MTTNARFRAKVLLVLMTLVGGVLMVSTSSVRAQSPDCTVRGQAGFPDGTRIASHIQTREDTASGRHNHIEPGGDFTFSVVVTNAVCDVSEDAVTARATGPARNRGAGGNIGLIAYSGGAVLDDGTREEGTYELTVTDASGRVVFDSGELPVAMTAEVAKNSGMRIQIQTSDLQNSESTQ